jgi:DNA-binding beta-propeller fold protein YncE
MRRNRMKGLRLLVTAAAMGGVSMAAACDGENLFSVPGGPGGPGGSDADAPEVTISAPRGDSLSAKALGDSVFVSARVTDDLGVRSVRLYGVAFRGDVNLGTNEIVDRFAEKTVTLPAGVTDTTLNRYLLPLPSTVKEQVSFIVEASDSTGTTGADTVSVLIGGPEVQLLDLVDGLSVKAGLNLSTRVRAIDPQGILQVRIEITGAFDTTLTHTVSPPADTAVFDTAVVVPAGITGTIEVLAVARNGLDVSGVDGPVTLNVVSEGGLDTIAPRLTHTTTAPERMELQDLVQVEITGSDDPQGTGVVAAGYTVLGISPAQGDTVVRSGEISYSPARTGSVSATFGFHPFNVDSLSLPDTVVFEITSWMTDASGNTAASVGLDTLMALPSVPLPGGEIVALGRAGERVVRSIVAGKTVLLPSGGKIMDAAVDTARGRLYLSNIELNRLDVFDLVNEEFAGAIGVGSEPWGLAFTRDNDSLWVANSGGTNLSVVDLDLQREVDGARFLTPDVVLFDVELKTSDAGVQYLVTPKPQPNIGSFSDRPQYVAVDSYGNLIYSTRTSELGELGTARKGYFQSGWARSEAKIFVEHGEVDLTENFWAIAHIDSISTAVDTIGADSLGQPIVAGRMALFDHVPGFPSQVVTGIASSTIIDAVQSAAAELIQQGSDVLVVTGAKWNVPSLAFLDTTYVAGSGDGNWVSVGEGGAEGAGRVLSYKASPGNVTALSGFIQVADLLTNPSDEVRGLGLNYDGTLGVARGRFAAYFFSPPDLRLQGITEIPLATQGQGATLHPLHANTRTLENLGGAYRPDTHIAFVASGAGTIDIIDTQRFTRIGRIHIRDIVTGPLRAAVPFPEDNAGLTCSTLPTTDMYGNPIGNAVQIYEGGDFNQPIAADGITEDRCVVLKLFGTTSSGGVLVIDVRKADILREHPARL